MVLIISNGVHDLGQKHPGPEVRKHSVGVKSAGAFIHLLGYIFSAALNDCHSAEANTGASFRN